ncbi:hypothetical protein T261_03751 [Streptomyces lydicus]|nr:hypothetical protein T261_03751 [Streptomyces lydicus]
MRRHGLSGPVALRAMQDLAGRVFPTTGYRHIGDLTWNWCLSLDRADECPTAVWTQAQRRCRRDRTAPGRGAGAARIHPLRRRPVPGLPRPSPHRAAGHPAPPGRLCDPRPARPGGRRRPGIGTPRRLRIGPDHRRTPCPLGLARAVCTAVLHAFADTGGRRAVVYARGDAGYPVPQRSTSPWASPRTPAPTPTSAARRAGTAPVSRRRSPPGARR